MRATLAADQGMGLGLYFNHTNEEDWLKLDAAAGYVYSFATEVPAASSGSVVSCCGSTELWQVA